MTRAPLTNPTATFGQLVRAVAAARSEQRAVNECIRKLAALGYVNAQRPEVSQGSVDRAVMRFYVWRDTPFGDDVVLATGNSFESKVALASDIPSTPGVGIFIQAEVLAASPRAMRRAEQQAAYGAARGAAAPRAPRKPRAEREVAAPRAHIPRVTREDLDEHLAREIEREPVFEPAPPTHHIVPAPARMARSAHRREGSGSEYRSLAAERAEREAADAQRAAEAEASRLAADAKRQQESEAADTAKRGKRAMASFLSFLESAE